MMLAAAAVLYQPDPGMIQRLYGSAAFLDFLVIVDNTEGQDLTDAFKQLPNVAYTPLGENKGIAAAFNIAAAMAIHRKFAWMMMLDQDSRLSKNAYEELRAYAPILEQDRVALFAPLQASKRSDAADAARLPAVMDVNRTMSSGSSLSLAAYAQCGPFEDKLFIDHVDNEYCLRLRQAGFRIVQLTRLILDHSLGEVRDVTLLGHTMQFISHKPFRSYYFVRNGFYVAVKFIGFRPQFLALQIYQIGKDILKAILLEKDTRLRLTMMARGFLDFCRGRYGKL